MHHMGEITGAVWLDKYYSQTNVLGAGRSRFCLLRSICLGSPSLPLSLSPSDRLLLCAWIKAQHSGFMGSAKSSACFANSVQLLRGGRL